MEKYWDLFIQGYTGYANYLWKEVTNPKWGSYFYMLILVSIIFFIFEVIIPWRKKQPIIRKDFWLDAFYMFFNFFLFSLIIYAAVSNVVVELFNDGVKALTGFELAKSNPFWAWPQWAILLIAMITRDFIQWWTHRLLHRVDWLWEFHKVHHSVEQMGFAAQLRYHWFENIVYRSIEYLPLALLFGINLHTFFVIHIIGLTWGHFNHANITVDGKVSGGVVGGFIGLLIANSWLEINLLSDPSFLIQAAVVLGGILLGVFVMGPMMRIMFNSPEMHIWHHAHDLPKERRYGVNFGLTLACWDYIFGTAYIPHDGRDIKLGFEGMDKFPSDFIHQNMYGIIDKKK